MKTFNIKTFGCKVNQYESENIREQLEEEGYVYSSKEKNCALYVVNTCTVTSRSDEKSLKLIRKLKRQNPHSKLIVTGCITEDIINKNTSGVDYLIPNNLKHLIAKIIKNGSPTTGVDRLDNIDKLKIKDFKAQTRAFLKIQDGCPNRCSYCKIWQVRGGFSRSKNPSCVIQEAKSLLEKGFKEIVLCGICLGAYGEDLKIDMSLVNLLKKLSKLKQNFRIRLSSIEPEYISDELIEYMKYSKNICRHLHIPLQSGDDYILGKMNRRYNGKQFYQLIEKIKVAIANVSITTDVMVGFPGESDKNFDNTYKLLQKILPLRMHIFPFSPRPKTEAFNFKPKVPEDIKKCRIEKLRHLTDNLSLKYRREFLNKTLEVLIESNMDKNLFCFYGYSDNYIKVYVKNDGEFGMKDETFSNEVYPVRGKTSPHIIAYGELRGRQSSDGCLGQPIPNGVNEIVRVKIIEVGAKKTFGVIEN